MPLFTVQSLRKGPRAIWPAKVNRAPPPAETPGGQDGRKEDQERGGGTCAHSSHTARYTHTLHISRWTGLVGANENMHMANPNTTLLSSSKVSRANACSISNPIPVMSLVSRMVTAHWHQSLRASGVAAGHQEIHTLTIPVEMPSKIVALAVKGH